MRALILLSLLLAPAAHATQPEAQITANSGTVEGTPSVDPRATAPKLSNYGVSEKLRTAGLFNDSVTFNLGLNTVKNDYSNTTVILDSESTATSPLKFNGPETSAEVGAELKRGDHTFTTSYGQMLTNSPYPYHAVSAGYNRSFYAQSTVVGGNLYYTKQDQPFTYFTSQQFRDNRLRPRTLTSERAEFWLEQALSENWKTQVKFLTGQRLEDRPVHYGAELRNTIALSDRWFTRLDIGMIRERTNRVLIDDSGYYSDRWIEGQLTYEPIYDFLITAAVGTSVEKEDVVWKNVTNQVGLDTYGLKLSYKGKTWTAGLNGTLGYSNTSYRNNAFSGTFSWNI